MKLAKHVAEREKSTPSYNNTDKKIYWKRTPRRP
jgi:hypothetical protein